MQAGHARFWQRPSHISHRDSPGLSAPRSDSGREWAQGSGQRAGDGTAPHSSPSSALAIGAVRDPAWPRNLEEGSRERRAGVGNKAPCAPRTAGRSRIRPRAGLPHLGSACRGDPASPTANHRAAPPNWEVVAEKRDTGARESATPGSFRANSRLRPGKLWGG